MELPEKIYLLYAGESEDGKGHPDYLGRTADKAEARKHWDSLKGNPYSVGKVVMITKTSANLMWSEADWE